MTIQEYGKDTFHDKEKAIHWALWLSFKYRIAGKEYGVIELPNGGFKVIESIIIKTMKTPFKVPIPEDYINLSYDELRHIKMDKDPLHHWEELCGTFSVMNGEILRYILHTKIPLEKLIRYELAIRGHNEDHHWVGFEEAERIWLEEK